VETLGSYSTLETLRAGLRGTAYAAGEDRARAAYSPEEDWERLVALKDRHDPDNLFRFNRNIAPSKARQ